jgi:hypothetical protein
MIVIFTYFIFNFKFLVKNTYIQRIAEVSQIFPRDIHVLPKLVNNSPFYLDISKHACENSNVLQNRIMKCHQNRFQGTKK